MRHVFSDAYTIAHLWAHQSQDEARHTSGHFYFEGNEIYSYGSHYVCGRIVTNRKGEQAYVLNADSYSNSTAKHMYCVRGAIPTGAKVFNVSGCECPDWNYEKENLYGYPSALRSVFYYLACIEREINAQSRARKYDHTVNILDYVNELRSWIEFWGLDKRTKWACGRWPSSGTKMMQTVDSLFARKNAVAYIKSHFCNKNMEDLLKEIQVYHTLSYFGLMSEVPHDPGFSLSAAINGVVQSYLGSDVCLQIEEMRKKEEKRLKSEILKKEKLELKRAIDELEEWHNGERNSWNPSYSFEKKFGWHTALRLNLARTYVQSSKNIKISIEEARRLWSIIKMFHNGKEFTHQLAVDLKGQSWKFNKYENNVLTAGCHMIPYSEMERIAKQLNFKL